MVHQYPVYDNGQVMLPVVWGGPGKRHTPQGRCALGRCAIGVVLKADAQVCNWCGIESRCTLGRCSIGVILKAGAHYASVQLVWRAGVQLVWY